MNFLRWSWIPQNNTLSWSSTRWMSQIVESKPQSSWKLQRISELVLWHNEESPAENRTVAERNRKTVWNKSRIFIGWDQDFWFLKKKKSHSVLELKGVPVPLIPSVSRREVKHNGGNAASSWNATHTHRNPSMFSSSTRPDVCIAEQQAVCCRPSTNKHPVVLIFVFEHVCARACPSVHVCVCSRVSNCACVCARSLVCVCQRHWKLLRRSTNEPVHLHVLFVHNRLLTPAATTVPILYCHFRYNTDILALNISRCGYQSDISLLRMTHTFIIYFLVWRVRKTTSSYTTNQK